MDNRAAAYANMGPVYNGPVSHQTISHDNAVTYEVEKEDVDFQIRVSRFLARLLGDKGALVATFLSLAGGVVSIFFSSLESRPAALPLDSSPALFGVGSVLIAMGVLLWWSHKFRKNARCVACKAYYTLREVGDGQVREVKTSEGIRKTTTRTYQCSNCSHEMTKKATEILPGTS